MALMGYREYSRHAGVSLRAVQKAIEGGYIQVTPEKKIDSDQADRDWRNSSDVQRPVMSIGQTHKTAACLAALGRDVQGRGEPIADGTEGEEGDASTNEYRTHRATREKYSALTQELEYKKLAGELIAVEEAKRIAYTTFRGIRDAVLNVPARLKDQLATLGDPHQCERLLETALADALAGIEIAKLLHEQDD